jgi:ribonuclease-3
VSEPIEDLYLALDYRFEDPALASTALSHPSHTHELDGTRGNERLEFLGDAVLDLVVAEMLYQRHPDWKEGQLTRARASMVNKRALARRARRLGLDELVQLGKTERRGGGHKKDSILANCFEAVLGALYLDGGLAPVERIIEDLFGEAVDHDQVTQDAKTAFQEWAHAELRVTPHYRTVGDTGVENDEGRFQVEVVVEAATYGSGVGRTKREAERAAASDALERRQAK